MFVNNGEMRHQSHRNEKNKELKRTDGTMKQDREIGSQQGCDVCMPSVTDTYVCAIVEWCYV